MAFRIRHLMLGLLLTVPAGAEPTTQPEAPPIIIKGVVISKPIAADDVKVAVRSVRHQVVYDIVDGTLKPAQQGPVPAWLRCEVGMPAGTGLWTYRSELTALEDDAAGDLLKPFRTPNGAANIGLASGSFLAHSDEKPTMLEVPLPVFPGLPHTVGRIAGVLTLCVPAEERTFDLPLDKIGANAVISDAVALTLVSCEVLRDTGPYEVRLQIKGPPGVMLGMVAAPRIRTAVGLGESKPNGQTSPEYGAMHFQLTGDSLTVQFEPSRDKLIKTLRLFVITKTLEVPLQYDIRTRPMM